MAILWTEHEPKVGNTMATATKTKAAPRTVNSERAKAAAKKAEVEPVVFKAPPYRPRPTKVSSPVTVTNGDSHTIGFMQFKPEDLVIIPRLQRGHGPGTAGWNRAKALLKRWDSGKVLTLDVAEIKLTEDTEVLTMHGLVVLKAGTTVFHVMDGAHRLCAVWIACLENVVTDDPQQDPDRVEVAATTNFLANVYRWTDLTDIDDVVSKYFIAKNRERSNVSRSDQLKMRINRGDTIAIDIHDVVSSLGLFLPFDIDEMRAKEQSREATKLQREGSVIGAVAVLENIYSYWGRSEKFKDESISLEDPAHRDQARTGLLTTLSVAGALFDAKAMKYNRQPIKDRWLGDYLFGLTRVLYKNPELAEAVLDPERGADYRKVVQRFHKIAKTDWTFGPRSFSSLAGIIAAEHGASVIANDQSRSYWVGYAIADAYNYNLRVGRLVLPTPPRALPVAFADVENFDPDDVEEGIDGSDDVEVS